jgi:hypothetical protein
MNSIRAAFYARVSSEQQAAAHTIESQLVALTTRYGWILVDRGRHRIRTVVGPSFGSALLPVHDVRLLGTDRVCSETEFCVSHR